MDNTTSSAVPEQLLHYADIGQQINASLQSHADRLAAVLAQFQATCTEYRIQIDHLPGQLASLAHMAAAHDQWVSAIAQQFRAADQERPKNFVETITQAMGAAVKQVLTGHIGDSINQYTGNLETNDPTLPARYRIGPPQRPAIYHDEGFADGIREPAWQDYAEYYLWKYVLAEAGEAFKDVPDAISAYRHFLDASGTDRTFSYERFVASDESGQTVLNSSIQDTQNAAQNLYQQIITEHPELKDRPLTFQLTSDPLYVNGHADDYFNQRYPYPATENWQKTIGAHVIWISATVTVTPGSAPAYTMDFMLHAEDKYNFNPDQHDMATGIPDSANGGFEETGLGKEYMHYAQLERTVTWQEQPLGADGGAVSGEPKDRDRAPQDNHRLRNRR